MRSAELGRPEVQASVLVAEGPTQAGVLHVKTFLSRRRIVHHREGPGGLAVPAAESKVLPVGKGLERQPDGGQLTSWDNSVNIDGQ